MAVDADELRRLANDCAEDGLHTVAEQLRADANRIDRLRRWKAEATEVLTEWDAVHQALGSPGRPGQSKAAASKAEIDRIISEYDRLRDAIESHRASSRLALFLNDLPRAGVDSLLWSVLSEDGDSNG